MITKPIEIVEKILEDIPQDQFNRDAVKMLMMAALGSFIKNNELGR